MNEQRFDELSKRLATSVSRRQAVRILGTTAVGGFAALFGARGAFADHNANCRDVGANCRSNAECCTGVCTDFHCACAPGFVICNGQCVPVCDPPQVLDPTTCTCGCDPAIVCPPPKVVNPQTCACVCPPGTTACGQSACCGPNQVCQGGTCVTGVTCGGQLCDPFRCCTWVGGQECCSGNQVCSPFSGCI